LRLKNRFFALLTRFYLVARALLKGPATVLKYMKSTETTVMDRPEEVTEMNSTEQTKGVITLPMGLLGFEQYKRYTLLGSPEEAPFLWLHMLDNDDLSFLVISPFMVMPSYQPDLSEEDSKFLGLENSDDALIFNIVTVHPDGNATVNLKGPIVVNRQTLTGKQCIPRNSASYSLQHPIESAK
jgi:flagellar assembly factor FliW